jgi:hypothetical protein
MISPVLRSFVRVNMRWVNERLAEQHETDRWIETGKFWVGSAVAGESLRDVNMLRNFRAAEFNDPLPLSR